MVMIGMAKIFDLRLLLLAYCLISHTSLAMQDAEFLLFLRANSIGDGGNMDPWLPQGNGNQFKYSRQVTWYYAYGDLESAFDIGVAWVVSTERPSSQHIRDGEHPNQTQMYYYLVDQMQQELTNRSIGQSNPDTWIWYSTFLERLIPFGFDPATHVVTPIKYEFGETDRRFQKCIRRQGLALDIQDGALNGNLLTALAPLGHPSVADHLLNVVGLDPNFTTCNDETAAFIATQFGHWEYAKHILNHPEMHLEKHINLIWGPTQNWHFCNLPTGCIGHEGQTTLYDLWRLTSNIINSEDPKGKIGSQWRMRKWLLEHGARSGKEIFWRQVCELKDPVDWPLINKLMDDLKVNEDTIHEALSRTGDLAFLYRTERANSCQKYLKQVLWRCQHPQLRLDCELINDIQQMTTDLNLPWSEVIPYVFDFSSLKNTPLSRMFYFLLYTPVE